MTTRYFKEMSLCLQREMEFKVFGSSGRLCLVFPSQNGRFYDFENFGMVEVLHPLTESGRLMLVCADGIDKETWSDEAGDPRSRIELHEKWYQYIIEELLPRARELGRTTGEGLVYANSPLHFLPNMPPDHPHMELYRTGQIILCVGQGAWEDDLLASIRRMDALLRQKGIPAWIDYWGPDVSHDWCWWQKQLPYFFDKINL